MWYLFIVMTGYGAISMDHIETDSLEKCSLIGHQIETKVREHTTEHIFTFCVQKP